MEELLKDLASLGCWPCISRRSAYLWRAHVNQAGNFWADEETPLKALRKAATAWHHAGKPVEGTMATLADTLADI